MDKIDVFEYRKSERIVPCEKIEIDFVYDFMLKEWKTTTLF